MTDQNKSNARQSLSESATMAMPDRPNAQIARVDAGGKMLSLIIAPLCVGCAAAALAYCANHAFSLFEAITSHWRWWPFLVLPVGGAALTFFIRRAGTGSEGSGIQQAIAALFVTDKPERLRGLLSLRIAAVKLVAIIGGLFSGFVLGLEGPTVQIGASIFQVRFYRQMAERLLPCAHPQSQ